MKDDFNPYGDTTEEDNIKVYNPKDKSAKIKKEKKVKPIREIKAKDIVKTENESSENEIITQDDNNRTYMDDFSDILSDLEDYKNKNKNNSDKKKKHRRDGK